MEEMPEVLVAGDFIQKIVDGETGIVDAIETRFAGCRIVVADLALCEGLEASQQPTVEGLAALARLIRMADVVQMR